jgi:DNA-binding LacI/PurR family transcriptional regulator
VDGAVVILQHEISDIVAHLERVRQPIAYVGRPLARSADASPTYVDSDNYGGGRMAARALLAAGRTRIATIAGPSDMQAAIDRLAGWRDELVESGRPAGAIVHGEFTMASGAEAMSRLLSRQADLDGLFAASDLMAIGAARVLSAAGRGVPRDVSLIGFDDTVLAATAEPPLTTVRQPLEELGRTAAEVVLRLIDDPSAVEPIVLPTQLVQRDSV